MSAEKGLPDGSFRFVLRTYRDYDATIARAASTYGEATNSRDVTHPDGIRRPTIFLATEAARDRLTKLGWEDVSALWEKEIAKRNPTPPPTPATEIQTELSTESESETKPTVLIIEPADPTAALRRSKAMSEHRSQSLQAPVLLPSQGPLEPIGGQLSSMFPVSLLVDTSQVQAPSIDQQPSDDDPSVQGHQASIEEKREGWVDCDDCGGSGLLDGGTGQLDDKDCPVCDGESGYQDPSLVQASHSVATTSTALALATTVPAKPKSKSQKENTKKSKT